MDSAWCPVCDKQIQPKRITTQVPRTVQPTPPPPPPSSPRRKGAPRKAGLVNGTGRLRHNGTIKPPPAPAPIVVMKERVVIDQGPTPLYCSDECQMADLARSSRSAVLDPAREEATPSPTKLNKKTFTLGDSDSEPSTSHPSKPLTSIDKFAAFYNFPEMPPAPVFEREPVEDMVPLQYNSGIMMAGRLITSLCPPPAKPHVGRYAPAQEARKPVPGWTDGSHAWRSAVYSTAAPITNRPFQGEAAVKAYGSFSAPRRAPRMSRASSAATLPSEAYQASAAEALLSSFSEKFSKRSESRASLYNGGGGSTAPSPVASSAASTHSAPLPSPRHRSLVPSSVEGKLLVPNVKMRVHSGSSASLSSNWSGLGTSSSHSKRSTSVRSPLSLTSDSDEDTERGNSKLSSRRDAKLKRPTVENTRSWSYDNVQTYDIMPLIPKKVKKIEKRVVDGVEQDVEVEVEEYPECKRLFLFPPSQRISVP